MAAMRVRVRPSVKAAAVRMAQEDNLSMAEWLEWLIEAEKARLDGKKVPRNQNATASLISFGRRLMASR